MFYISPFIPLLQGGHFLFGFIAIPISFAALTVLGGIKVTTWRICRFPTGASAEQRYARAVTVRALTFALTHLTSARTAGVRCAMKCLVRPFIKRRTRYGDVKGYTSTPLPPFLKGGGAAYLPRRWVICGNVPNCASLAKGRTGGRIL